MFVGMGANVPFVIASHSPENATCKQTLINEFAPTLGIKNKVSLMTMETRLLKSYMLREATYLQQKYNGEGCGRKLITILIMLN